MQHRSSPSEDIGRAPRKRRPYARPSIVAAEELQFETRLQCLANKATAICTAPLTCNNQVPS